MRLVIDIPAVNCTLDVEVALGSRVRDLIARLNEREAALREAGVRVTALTLNGETLPADQTWGRLGNRIGFPGADRLTAEIAPLAAEAARIDPGPTAVAPLTKKADAPRAPRPETEPPGEPAGRSLRIRFRGPRREATRETPAPPKPAEPLPGLAETTPAGEASRRLPLPDAAPEREAVPRAGAHGEAHEPAAAEGGGSTEYYPPPDSTDERENAFPPAPTPRRARVEPEESEAEDGDREGSRDEERSVRDSGRHGRGGLDAAGAEPRGAEAADDARPPGPDRRGADTAETDHRATSKPRGEEATPTDRRATPAPRGKETADPAEAPERSERGAPWYEQPDDQPPAAGGKPEERRDPGARRRRFSPRTRGTLDEFVDDDEIPPPLPGGRGRERQRERDGGRGGGHERERERGFARREAAAAASEEGGPPALPVRGAMPAQRAAGHGRGRGRREVEGGVAGAARRAMDSYWR
ncbi:MAG: hypothetical protein HY719_08520, partial [Planctomycetes bacterium]|nr:hypothetical protein [Planctomycetota bacterium]